MNFVSRFLRRSIICRLAHDLRYVSIAAASTSASSASNLMFSSKPCETPEGDVLDDLELALMGDFVGVKPSPTTIENKTTKDPEISVAKLQEEIYKNRYLKAHNFITSILQPLERKIEPFCAIVRNSPSFYASILIEMCGEVMTDIPTQNRMIILNRLVKSMTGVGMKMSIDVLNSMVQVWLQNYHSFDVRALLEFAERRLDLQPNSTFFTLCAWQLARQGDSEALGWLKKEIRLRELEVEGGVELSTIFCAERCGNAELGNELLAKFLHDHAGEVFNEEDDAKTAALSAAFEGAAWHGDMERLRELMEMGTEVLFEVFWILATKHSKDYGREFTDFIKRALEKARRNDGFFKLLFCQANRHLAHQAYYTAITFIADTNRVMNYLEQQSKNTYLHHALPKISNHIVRNNLPIPTIAEISQTIVSTFGEKIRYYDGLMFSILTHRNSTHEQRFERFRAFIDFLDPNRQRIHLILPLLVRCDSLQSRCKLIYLCSSMGYKQFSELQGYIIHSFLILPILYISNKQHYEDMWDGLDELVRHLKSFGISEPELWRMFYVQIKEFDMLREKRDISSRELHKNKRLDSWLRANVHYMQKESLAAEAAQEPLMEKVEVSHLLNALYGEYQRSEDISGLNKAAHNLRARYPNVAVGRIIAYETSIATVKLIGKLVEGPLLTERRIDEIIELLTTLIKLNFISLRNTEMITCNIVYNVLCDLGWDMAVETWMRFQTQLNCPNAIVELLKFAIRMKLKEDEINYVLHKAGNFLSPKKAKAIYVSALVSLTREAEAAEFLEKCDLQIDLQDFQHAFLVMCARIWTLHFVSISTRFPREFVKIAMDHCAHRSSQAAKRNFAQLVIQYCNKYDYGFLALDMLELFNNYGVSVDKHNLKLAKSNLATVRNELIGWSYKYEGRMLNGQNAKEAVSPRLIEVSRKMAELNI